MGVLIRATAVTIPLVAPPIIALVGPATIPVAPMTPTIALIKPPKSAVQLAIPGPVATQICTPSGGQADSNLKTLARGSAWEDQDVTTLARIMLPSSGPMLQADMSGTATLNVYDLGSDTPDTAIITTASIAASSIIYDALQIDSYWNTDNVGYNFRHTNVVTSGKLLGGKIYRLEYSFDTDNDGLVYVISEIAVQGLYST